MGALFNALVTASLQNRVFVLVIAAVLVGYGGWTLTRLPVDVFPDLNRPTVTLLTEAVGMAPEEVEQLVTYPVETAMNGMPGVTRVRSVSGVGLSVIYVEFGFGTELLTNRQQVPSAWRRCGRRCPQGSCRRWGRSPPSWARSCWLPCRATRRPC